MKRIGSRGHWFWVLILGVLLAIGCLVLCCNNHVEKALPSGFVSIEEAMALLDGKYRFVSWESQLSVVENGSMNCVAQWDIDDKMSVIERDGKWYVNKKLIDDID